MQVDGTGLHRVSTGHGKTTCGFFFGNDEMIEAFDGFPMFSRDGRSLVWASNRRDAKPRETNLFLADWVN